MARSAQDYKDLSIQEFTRAANIYETSHAGIYEMCRDDYPEILAEIEKEPFETLLDAGCGPAPMVQLLAEQYPDAHYTGIDLTPKMIELARAKNLPNADFVVGDCENLPFEDNSFDVVICSMSFHHYPHPQDFFNSVARVLRPSGRFILRDSTSNKPIVLWLMNHIELPLCHLVGHGDVHVYSTDEVRKLASTAGLEVECAEARPNWRLHAVMRKN